MVRNEPHRFFDVIHPKVRMEPMRFTSFTGILHDISYICNSTSSPQRQEKIFDLVIPTMIAFQVRTRIFNAMR